MIKYNIDLTKNTDKSIILRSTDLDLSTITFVLDLVHDNVKSCEFTYINDSANISRLTLARSVTKDLPTGIHKGNLIYIDAMNKAYDAGLVECNVKINYTEIV